MSPRVSVLMAHAGPPIFLDAACGSICAQEYRDFELVVVDDGAGLDWDAFLRALDRPWRVVNNPTRRGLARSMNLAASMARGSLLARMDSDDVSAPSRLKSQVAHLDARRDIAFLGSAVYWLDERGGCLGRNYPLTDRGDLSVGLSTYNQMCHGSMLVRRDAFEGVCGYDESLSVAQDYDLWVRASQAGHAFANLPEPLYGHRLHSSSTSSRGARAQGDVAGRVWGRESAAVRSARVDAWFDAGRDGRLGRPYESLQLGRLAMTFVAAAATNRIEGPSRRSVLRFSALHAVGALELLMREVGWRRDTATKLHHLLHRG